LDEVFDLTYLYVERSFVAALRTRVDAGRNSSGSELFSAESTATLDAYMEMLKSGLRYVGIICHGGGSCSCSIKGCTNFIRGEAAFRIYCKVKTSLRVLGFVWNWYPVVGTIKKLKNRAFAEARHSAL
jgi:hypothetical protein